MTRRAAGGTGGSSDTRELQLALVDTLLQASYSPDSARQDVRAGALAPLAEVLRGRALGSPRAFRDEGVAPTTELLWNLFEAVPEAKALEPAAKDTDYIREGLGRPYKALRDLMAESLLSILGEFLCKGYRAQDKELRNEVLLIIMFLVEEPVNHPAFVEAGLLELALDVAVMPELRAESARVTPFVLTKETDDHEAKLLVWHVMAKLCRGGSEGAGAGGGDRRRGGQGHKSELRLLPCRRPSMGVSGMYFSCTWTCTSTWTRRSRRGGRGWLSDGGQMKSSYHCKSRPSPLCTSSHPWT